MTIDQLKAVMTFEKRHRDDAIPTKKEALITQYNETYDHSHLQLNKWLSENNKSSKAF